MHETTNCRVKKDTMNRLRMAVLRKHGSLYGNLSVDIEQAIEDRIMLIGGA